MFLNRLHHTALLVRDISHPIRLPRRNEQMRRPPIHMSIELVLGIDIELGRIAHGARGAVLITILAVDRGVDFREERIVRRDGREAIWSVLAGPGEEGSSATEKGLHLTYLLVGCDGWSRKKEDVIEIGWWFVMSSVMRRDLI